jgi:hypothetical protein
MHHMCGNILEVRAKDGSIIVMSRRPYDNFTRLQREEISGYGRILPVDIGTIETTGGRARCMLGELF